MAIAALDTAAVPWVDVLPWQQGTVATVVGARAQWPHALLLAGPRGIGKRVLALNLARALLCEEPRADGFACKICASCRYMAAGQHPDFQLVEPFAVEDDGAIKVLDAIPVDRIRAVREWVQLTSHRGRAKVAVVVPAESMNMAASNALLKTLEEPPAATFFILVSHQPGRVAATLRSRCRRLPAPFPDPGTAQRWLADAGIANPVAALAEAGGAPLLALDTADPARQAERAAWLQALAKPKTLSPVALAMRIEAAPKDERKERLGLAVDWLVSWTADLGRAFAGGAPSRNVDFSEELAVLAKAVAPVALFRYHRVLLRQRALVAHPLQPRLVVEALLFAYRDLFR